MFLCLLAILAIHPVTYPNVSVFIRNLMVSMLSCLPVSQGEENTVMKKALGNLKNTKHNRMCWQDGRLFEDKEDWVVDSCTKCTCQVEDIGKRDLGYTGFKCYCSPLWVLLFVGRNRRLCATRLLVLLWPVPFLFSWKESAVQCVCVSIIYDIYNL